MEFAKITASYKKTKYREMILPLLKILSNPEILKLLIKATVNFTKYNIQKYITSNYTRQKAIGAKFNKLMENITQKELVGNSDKKFDLSVIFQQESQNYNSIATNDYSSIMSYSLANKDLRGVSFETINMKLDNFIIKNFNFDGVKFSKCSFKNSVLENYSFNGVQFANKISFEGATIDSDMLQTLVPAIEKYNKAHPLDKMNLENVKILGDITRLKDNSLLKNANLTEAFVVEKEIKEDNVTEKKTHILNFQAENKRKATHTHSIGG